MKQEKLDSQNRASICIHAILSPPCKSSDSAFTMFVFVLSILLGYCNSLQVQNTTISIPLIGTTTHCLFEVDRFGFYSDGNAYIRGDIIFGDRSKQSSLAFLQNSIFLYYCDQREYHNIRFVLTRLAFLTHFQNWCIPNMQQHNPAEKEAREVGWENLSDFISECFVIRFEILAVWPVADSQSATTSLFWPGCFHRWRIYLSCSLTISRVMRLEMSCLQNISTNLTPKFPALALTQWCCSVSIHAVISLILTVRLERGSSGPTPEPDANALSPAGADCVQADLVFLRGILLVPLLDCRSPALLPDWARQSDIRSYWRRYELLLLLPFAHLLILRSLAAVFRDSAWFPNYPIELADQVHPRAHVDQSAVFLCTVRFLLY